MNPLLALCVIASLILIHTTPSIIAYHPDFTWENVETMMNPDLRGRMERGARDVGRKYCGDCSKVPDDENKICGNNGIMYPNSCLFECSKLKLPNLQEAEDYAKCGSMSFSEFKLESFKPHY